MSPEVLLAIATAVILSVSLAVPLWPQIEKPLQWWLVYWHGQGAANQHQFYRCHGCQGLVTHTMIAMGGCACKMGRNRVSPTYLRVREKVRLLALPWTVR